MNDRPQPPDSPPDSPASADTADTGASGPGRPSIPDRRRRPWQLALVLAAVLAVVGILAVTLTGGDDDDSGVRADRGSAGSEGSDAAASAATVAVTFGEASVATTPADLTLRFLDASGAVIATRSWSEVEQNLGGAAGDVTAMQGLVQDVPAGEVRLEATLQQSGQPDSCTQQFTPAEGDRLILRLERGPLGGMTAGGDTGGSCAPVQTVDEWVQGRTSPTGQRYVGLAVAEAQSRAEGAGLTTRVAGVDGMDLALTADFQPDRLNLTLFDGTVVAALLEGEGSGVGLGG